MSMCSLADKSQQETMPERALQYSTCLSTITLDDLQPRDFSFNAPYGACPDYDGLGTRKINDAAALIADPKLSVSEGVFGSLFNTQFTIRRFCLQFAS